MTVIRHHFGSSHDTASLEALISFFNSLVLLDSKFESFESKSEAVSREAALDGIFIHDVGLSGGMTITQRGDTKPKNLKLDIMPL